MLLRVRLRGLGSPDSPVTVDLPVFTLIQVDYVTGLALVSVPDEDVTPELARLKPPADLAYVDQLGLHQQGRDYVANTLDNPAPQPPAPFAAPAAVLDGWHEHLDTRYAEHAGEYRPQLA